VSSQYEAKIVPKNGLVGTYWEVYISHNNVKYDLFTSWLFSVAQEVYEKRKKTAEYLNGELNE